MRKGLSAVVVLIVIAIFLVVILLGSEDGKPIETYVIQTGDAIVDDGDKISEYSEAAESIIVREGDKFVYWSYARQQWLEFELLNFQPLQMRFPPGSPASIMQDPMYSAGEYMMVAEPGLVQPTTYFWMHARKDGTIEISSPFRRLLLVKSRPDPGDTA